MAAMPHIELHGLIVDFRKSHELLAAARAVREAGYTKFDCYCPFPIEGLSEAMGLRKTRLPMAVLAAAIAGGAGGYFMQYYSFVIDYPLNIGGRPHHAWPAFIPVTFELTILAAALMAVFGMILRNGLPRPYHPVFRAHRFERASQDRFFLCIEADDPQFHLEKTERQLRDLPGAKGVQRIER